MAANMNGGAIKVWAAPPTLDAFLYMYTGEGDLQHLNPWLEARDDNVYAVSDYDGHPNSAFVILPNGRDLYIFPGDLVIFENGAFRREPSPKYLGFPDDLALPDPG